MRAGSQLTGNQNVIKCESKRCLIRVQKGVSKGLKGHLLEAKRALIRMELTPSYFSRFEFPLQYRGTKEDRRIKNKDYVFYCHKQLINLLTCQLVNSPTRSYVTMSSSQATCLLVNSSTRQLVLMLLCLPHKQLVYSSTRQLVSLST